MQIKCITRNNNKNKIILIIISTQKKRKEKKILFTIRNFKIKYVRQKESK